MALVLCLLLCACDARKSADDDLHEARLALQALDWNYAERCFVRYLRVADEPESRWLAWQGLLTIVTRAGYMDRRTALDYLETMATEYSEDDAKMRILLPRMGEMAQGMRKYERALEIWDEYTQLSGLTEEETLKGYRQLARIYERMGRYAAAEGTLQDALTLAQSDEERAQCLYGLADNYIAREQWQEAVDLGLQLLDLTQDKHLRGRTHFLLGDALEQQKKLAEALQQFELAREGYPNALAVDNRVAYLKKKLGRK